jgi:hypothetical protein
MFPPILNAAIPLIAIFATTAAVLVYDAILYRAGKRTISDDTRDLYRKHGLVVPVLVVGTWAAYVGLATGALVVHFFLYMY